MVSDRNEYKIIVNQIFSFYKYFRDTERKKKMYWFSFYFFLNYIFHFPNSIETYKEKLLKNYQKW